MTPAEIRELAEIIREESPVPEASMPVGEYILADARQAMIRGLHTLADRIEARA